jgi:hypothetical protein
MEFYQTIFIWRYIILFLFIIYSFTIFKGFKYRFSEDYKEYSAYYAKKNIKVTGQCVICGRPIPQVDPFSKYNFCYVDNNAHNMVYTRIGYPRLIEGMRKYIKDYKADKNVFKVITYFLLFFGMILDIISFLYSINLLEFIFLSWGLLVMGGIAYFVIIFALVVSNSLQKTMQREKRLYHVKEPKDVMRSQNERAQYLLQAVQFIEQNYVKSPDECFALATKIGYPLAKKDVWFEMGKAFMFKSNPRASDHRRAVCCLKNVILKDHHYKERIIAGIFKEIRGAYNLPALEIY